MTNPKHNRAPQPRNKPTVNFIIFGMKMETQNSNIMDDNFWLVPENPDKSVISF